MEKSLFEQMGGTYTQVGDYLIPNLRLPEQQGQPIGVWGQRHARYLKQHHKIIYMNLLTSGKLNDYLVDIENQAENTSCKYGNFCLGCRATAIARNGNMFTKDPMCVYKDGVCPIVKMRGDN